MTRKVRQGTVTGTQQNAQTSSITQEPTLSELFWAFLRIGAMGFGGQFALISLLERVVVQQKRWMTTEQFIESSGMGAVAPGPISSNACAVVGYRLHGFAGGAIAYIAFHLPAVVMVLLLAGSFSQWESLPAVHGALRGVFAAVVGLLAGVAWNTGRSMLTSMRAALIMLTPFLAMTVFRINPVLIVLGAGCLGYIFLHRE